MGSHHLPNKDLQDFLELKCPISGQEVPHIVNLEMGKLGNPCKFRFPTEAYSTQNGIVNMPNKNVLDEFFTKLDACRQTKQETNYAEYQDANSSGFMYDFDIIQEKANSVVTSKHIESFIIHIVKAIGDTLEIKSTIETIRIAVIKKHAPVKQTNGLYKDGFHIIIPTVQTNRPNKKFIMQKLQSTKGIKRVLDEIANDGLFKGNVSNEHCKCILDANTAHIAFVFFIGCKSKTDTNARAYVMNSIYEIDCSTIDDMFTCNNLRKLDEKCFNENLCEQFSLNWSMSNTIYQKTHCDLKKSLCYDEEENKETEHSEALNIEQLINVDPDTEEIKLILKALSPSVFNKGSDKETKDNYGIKLYKFAANLLSIDLKYKDLLIEFYVSNVEDNKVKQTKLKHINKLCNTIEQKLLHGEIKKGCLSKFVYTFRSISPDAYEKYIEDSYVSYIYNLAINPNNCGTISNITTVDILERKFSKYVKYVNGFDIGVNSESGWYIYLTEDDIKYNQRFFYKKNPYIWNYYIDSIIQKDYPDFITSYLSTNTPNSYQAVLRRVQLMLTDQINALQVDNSADESKNKAKNKSNATSYLNIVYDNFDKYVKRMQNFTTVLNATFRNAMQIRFKQQSFAMELDNNAFVRGFVGGVLDLSTGVPRIVTGFNDYKVSKAMPYSITPFDKNNTLIREVFNVIRGLFHDKDAETFNFVMFILASTLTREDKSSMFFIIKGIGSNGKSLLCELHKTATGEYTQKLDSTMLTSVRKNADAASSSTMQIKHATLCYFNETGVGSSLNETLIKELTSGESVTARALYSNNVSFVPKTHYLVTTNNDLNIIGNDDGIWRRVKILYFKMKFIPSEDYYQKNEQEREYIREKNVDLGVKCKGTNGTNSKYASAYLGLLTAYYAIFNKVYKGNLENVPHTMVKADTTMFRYEQNKIDQFIDIHTIKCTNYDLLSYDKKKPYIMSITDLITRFDSWYNSRYQSTYTIVTSKKNSDRSTYLINVFKNSVLGTYMQLTSTHDYEICGIRIALSEEEKLDENEVYLSRSNLDITKNIKSKSQTVDMSWDYLVNCYENIMRQHTD